MKFAWILLSFTYTMSLFSQEVPDFRMKRVSPGQFYTVSIDYQGKRTVYYKTVITKPYSLSATEVTVGQWKSVMGGDAPNYGKDDDAPVTNVSYSEIQDFLSKLNKKASGKSYRLPTHAEWELAARGPGKSEETQSVFFWGNDAKQSSAYEWTYENAKGTLQKAGKLKPNPNGIYDLWGNVGEWVSDGRIDMRYYDPRMGNKGDGKCSNQYDPDYCYPANHVLTDPKGDSGADRFRVITESAGSGLYADRSGSYYRAYPKDFKSYKLGFRLARDED